MKNVIVFLLSAAFAAAVYAQDPVFYFPFDEGAGDSAKDVAGNVSAPVKAWNTSGKSKGALKLDGSQTSFVTVPKCDIGMSDFTVACWINPEDSTFSDLKDKRRRIIGLADNYPSVWFVIDLREGGLVSVEIGQKKADGKNAGSGLKAKTAAPLNTWTHMALVCDRGAKKLKLYINGVLDAEGMLNEAFDATLTMPKPTTIGGSWQNFKGSIDEVKLFLKTLSDGEIQSAMNAFYQGSLTPTGSTAQTAVPAAAQMKVRTENVKTSSVYYIAPDGDDAYSGTLPAANAAKTDGPFASMNGALEMLRGVRAQGKITAPVTVYLRGGTYQIKETITFFPEDSGTKDAPVSFEAYKNEAPVISGGRAITKWRQNGNIIETDIPSGVYFQELYVNGRRAVRSRHPNEGYFRLEGVVKDSKNEIIVKQEDIRQWENISDVNLYIYHSWTASVHWLKSVDLEKNKVTFANPSSYLGKWGEKNARFYLESCAEGFDAPGEWYLNRKTGVLKYMLRPGETAANVQAVAPRIARILDFKGDPKAGAFISYLSFKGIGFMHTDWGFAPPAMVDGQAHVGTRQAVIFAQGLRNTSFERCEISHGGAHAVWFEKGCFDDKVQQCHIFDHGGGGVYIGDTKNYPEADLLTARITVDNCFIHALNYVLQGAHGVWIGKGSQNVITHNDISDLNYSPIGAGWTWGFAQPSGAVSNVFEYNHLHHFGLGELSDMAGIYTLGISPGTVERYNLVHDANSYSYGGWGLYTDEGSSDILLEKNLVYNTKSGGFHQHYGSNCTIRNNIFAYAAEGNVISKRGDEKNISFIFTNNIVITTNGFMVDKGFRSKRFVLDNNIYWDINDASESNMSFSGSTFADWKSVEGYDQNSIVADPLFMDAKNFDFRLKPASPALKMGFEPFLDEIAKAGLYGDASWKGLTKKFTPRPVNTSMMAPKRKTGTGNALRFTEDFEAVAPGVPPPFGSADAGILTSIEQAKGKHSIKFLDADNLANEWRPHLSFENRFKTGVMKASLDVYLEDGAIFWHEWRDKKGAAGKAYLVGPTITIDASGDVLISKTKVTSVPRNKWIHLDFLTDIGAKSGTWDLGVTVDGETRREFRNLKWQDADFSLLEHMIWSSMAQTKTVFYVDNVVFEVVK